MAQRVTVNQAGSVQYTITASADSNGSISPVGAVTVNSGANQTFTITPKTGYQISDVKVDNTSVGAVTSYSFNNVTANRSIQASFKLPTYTITASADSNGSISPVGAVTVNSGASQSFTVAPNSGYQIADVTVDGTSVGAVTSYLFGSIMANHTILASFKLPATYTLSVAKSGTGTGTVGNSPGGPSYSAGTAVTLTAAPDANSTFGGWSGACSGSISPCTVTMNGNTSVTATFNLKTYTITASTGANGSISPQGTVTVNSGANQSFTVAPNSGYQIADVTVDGTSVGAVTSYLFGSVMANHTILASFKLPTYAITASADSTGSISPQGTVTVNSGTSQAFTIKPNSGYQISDVKVDGASTGKVSSYTFGNVMSNHNIQANFSPTGSAPGTVVVAVNAGGTQYSNGTGITYGGDKYYSGGRTWRTTAAIAGTTDDLLYQSERYGNFSYSTRVANGNYTVTLKFAEIYWSNAGRRKFNVKIGGKPVITELDIFAMVGKNQAYDVAIPVIVTNGILKIDFVTVVDNAKVSAILVQTR